MENTGLKEVINELENKLMINQLHHCHICGNPIEIFHKTDFLSLRVVETAKCAGCGTVLKNKIHTLH